MLPIQKANIRSPQTEPIDPFEGAGFLNYPACRIATSVEPDAPEHRKLFSPEELARLERMKSPQRRQEMAASFNLRRKLIGELINCAPDTVKLVTESDGAPKLEDPPGWSLSIANKGGATVVAIDPAPANIGVDLELVRALDWNSMLSMVSTELEREAFKQAFAERGNCEEAFLRLWTIKEAVLKATKKGFRAGPRAVETPPSILSGSGQGRLSAFGAHYDFWTTRSGEALISLARKRT